MALTDQLGAPASTKYITGDNTLHRYFLNAASVAAPVAAVNINGVQDVSADGVSFGRSVEMFHQGGGDERYKHQSMPTHNVTVKMFGADMPAFLAAIQSVTWGSPGFYAMPLVFADYPLINLESIYRLTDNRTHAGSMLYQDLILKPFTPGSPADNQIVDVPFYTRHVPLRLINGVNAVYDKYNGDGSTVAFTLSSTPVNVTDVSDTNAALKDDFVLDNLIFCKVKLSADVVGTRQKSGITLTGTTLTFTTAPAASSVIEVLYLKAT